MPKPNPAEAEVVELFGEGNVRLLTDLRWDVVTGSFVVRPVSHQGLRQELAGSGAPLCRAGCQVGCQVVCQVLH